MTWLRIDDNISDHPKFRRAGPTAACLWWFVQVACAKHDTDGIIEAYMVTDAAAKLDLSKAKTKTAASALVREGIWHDPASLAQCAKCQLGHGHDDWDGVGELAKGLLYSHDARIFLMDSEGKDDSLKAKRDRRRKALNRETWLRGKVRERDADLCRYCGVQTTWSEGPGGDRKTTTVGTLDHVEPLDFTSGPKGNGNSLENLVVACKHCNGHKRNATPDEASLVLHPAGSTTAAIAKLTPNQVAHLAGSSAGSSPDQAPSPEHQALPREAGPGLVGSWSDQGRRPDRGLVGKPRLGLVPNGSSSESGVGA